MSIVISGESSRIDEELKYVGQLHFKTDVFEDDYQKQFIESNMPRLRISLIIGIVAILAFMIEDLKLFPQESIQPYLIIRLGICVPFFILTYLVSRMPSMRRYTPYWLLTALLVFGLGSIAIIVINYSHNHISPYEGLLLMVIAAYFLVGLDFRTASMCSVLIALCYAYFVFFSSLSSMPNAVYGIAFLTATLAICAAAGYNTEKQLRINFLNNRKLSLLSETDGLTGLLNRTALELKLNQAVRSLARDDQGILFCFIDIDFFKQYNDHYGHPAGDATIQAVSNALQRCCKRPLDFCARYGGEEFALVWYPTKQSSIETIIADVQSEIAQLRIPHIKSTASEFVTVSGGIAYIETKDLLTNVQVIQLADEALYEAKRAGRNQFKVSIYQVQPPI